MNTEVVIHEPVSELITSAEWAAKQFRKAWDAATSALDAGLFGELVWTPKKRTRSLEANACMWACLTDISRQVVWYGQKPTPEEQEQARAAARKAADAAANFGNRDPRKWIADLKARKESGEVLSALQERWIREAECIPVGA